MKIWTIIKTAGGFSFHISNDGEQPQVGVIASGELYTPDMVPLALNMFAVSVQSNLDHLFNPDEFPQYFTDSDHYVE